MQLIEFLHRQNRTRIESTPQADQAWRQRIDEYAAGTLFGKAESWYMSANVPGKARQMINYPRGIPDYLQQWREVKARGYGDFRLA